MMDILAKIVADKQREVALKKTVVPVSQLEKYALFDRGIISMADSIRAGSGGIIAEHKRRSPSKSVINQGFSVEKVVRGYADAGAAGISVLTDGHYFGGSLEDLVLARACVDLPLLRKEFIIDEYQIVEAMAHGADAILLIAAILSPPVLKSLAGCARGLGLEILLEVHSLAELRAALIPGIQMVGVNNRNLQTFEVSLDTSRELSESIPPGCIRISESGIDSAEAVRELRRFGYHGFLVGEHFMRTENPGSSAKSFISSLRQ